MRIKSFGYLVGIVMILLIGQSCEKEEYETKISSYNSDESHHEGENCMSCHTAGGDGEGWFTVAGTVYDSLKTSPFSGATVKLYTSPNGTGDLKATIEVDKEGNFYTTESIEFGNGLYTFVQGNTSTNHMNSVITSGACNSCHSQSTDRIWTK